MMFIRNYFDAYEPYEKFVEYIWIFIYICLCNKKTKNIINVEHRSIEKRGYPSC
jgi:hypothetical protein